MNNKVEIKDSLATNMSPRKRQNNSPTKIPKAILKFGGRSNS